MDSLFVNINIKFCSMTGSFIDEHLNRKIDKGEIPELQVYSTETSDTDHNIDVVDPVIPSVQGEADGLPDGHRPIAVDKPTEVISEVVDPVIPSVQGRLTGCQTAIAPSPSKAKKEAG